MYLDKNGIYASHPNPLHGDDQLGPRQFWCSTQIRLPLAAVAIALLVLSLALQLFLDESAHAGEERGDTALMAAVRQGDLARIQVLLDHGADPNVSNEFGTTPLLFSAAQSVKGQAQPISGQVIKLLLQHGANVNAQAINGRNALMAAAGSGSIENVQILLAAGANPNLQSKNGDSALLEATARGHTDVVIALLLADANANLKDINGQTPLMVAIRQAPQYSRVRSPYEVIADALLAHGANPDIRDHNGQSPVTLVAAGDKNVLIYPLIDHHANINVTDPTAAGATPLIIAARHGNTALVKALLRAHPDLTYRDQNGETALEYASQLHFSEIVTLLSHAGAHN